MRPSSLRPGFAFWIFALTSVACGRVPISNSDGSPPNGTGKAGQTGSAGTSSAGRTGTTGAAGVKGTAGTVGAAGTIGAAGANGAAGTVGAAGVKGTAGTVGAAGVNGAAGVGFAGTSGAAGTTPAFQCTPGTPICYSAGYQQICQFNGLWGTPMACPYGCMNGVCSDCLPTDSQCTSPTTLQSCTNGKWGAPFTCANGCEGGNCAPLCQPTTTQCGFNGGLRVCGPKGLWGAETDCPHGCENGACRDCDPFMAECMTPTTSRLCQPEGKWGMPFKCAQACADGRCTDCMPGETSCLDDKNVRNCTDNGTWDVASKCDTLCFADACHVCKPGQLQCQGGDAITICGSDGEWADVITCANVCANGVCTTNPKKVFVTSTTYRGGDLGGLDGADAKCQARAAAANLPGKFRAWLSDFTGSPSTRFTQNGGPFQLVTGSIVANNWTGLTSGTLRHSINITELGTAAPASMIAMCDQPLVWTDTTSSGDLADQQEDCGDWTDPTGTRSYWGTTTSQGSWTQACDGGNSPATGCAAVAPLFCFEQ